MSFDVSQISSTDNVQGVGCFSKMICESDKNQRQEHHRIGVDDPLLVQAVMSFFPCDIEE
jgi:hypothetical protein